MSYRNHYSGSPWQQGGPPFGVSGYGSNYGGYNDQYMMGSSYSRNQGGYGGGGMYGGGGGGMRNMGYGGSQSRYGSDRMGRDRQMMPHGLNQRKRLPPRSPGGGPGSKRSNFGMDDRRMAKPRYRRDYRGRGRYSDEDDTYNPAEPTDDLSDVECDDYESWKGSGDEEEEEEEETKEEESKEPAKENGEQETDGEKKEEVAKPPPKKYICYVCKVTCSKEGKYKKHRASKDHTSKIEELLAIRREKKEAGDKESTDKDKDGKDVKKRSSSRRDGNWCTLCEISFWGDFLMHRQTKEHNMKRDMKFPKCRPCRMGFTNHDEFKTHNKSESHKARSAEFHFLRGLYSGSDEDEEAIQPAKVEPEEEKMEEESNVDADADAESDVKIKEEITEEGDASKEKTDDDAEGASAAADGDATTTDGDATTTDGDAATTDSAEKKTESKKEEKKRSRPREPKAYGQSFVIAVEGFFCKICRKFFRNVSVAKSKHCRSVMHTENYKKGMEKALVDEEERQKEMEEQDKRDQKRAEAAERAAEIAFVERSAKEAAKREAAKKKAGTSSNDDVEMKEVIDDSASDEKTTESVPENGVKETSSDTVEEKSEKPASESQEETAEGEEEGDEEQDKEVATKEEVTSSPAAKRGRGRGRGRKRR